MRNSVEGLCEIQEDHVDLTTDLRMLSLSSVMLISYIKVLFGSFTGAGRVLNFYKGSCVGPDNVVVVEVAEAFHQVIECFDTN